MTLKSVLGKYDRELRKYCKWQLLLEKNSEAALVILENISVLSSAINSAKGFLSRYGDEGLLPLFFMCRKFIGRDIAVNDESIIAYFSSRSLSVLQCEALFCLLFAAAACTVCDMAQAQNEKGIFSLFDKLAGLRDADAENVVRGLCRTEKYLSEDPTGEYVKTDSSSRRAYRFAVKRGAEKEGISETDFVKNALKKAREEDRHIGFFLPVFPDTKKKRRAFIALHWLVSLLLSLIAALFCRNLPVFPFLLLPFYVGLKPFADLIFSRLFKVRILPSLKEEEKYLKPFVISVCTIVPDKCDADKLYSHLKRLKFSTENERARVLLLCDRKSSAAPERAEDEKEIDAVKALIDRLNGDFGGGFSVFVRDRVFSFTENEYTGYERKRGAVCELCKYIKDGETGSFGVIYGDVSDIRGSEYLLTLDSDTMPSFSGPDRLLRSALHPLNRPVYSAEKKRIVSGYGIIVPRVEVSVEASCRSSFARLNTFAGGVAYSQGTGDRLFSLFGESVFCGKGLICVDAFCTAVCDRFDEGRILSHDVPEGAVLRTGFCAVSEVTEAFPQTVAGYYSRLHRWIRGDVQNVKYLFCPLGGKKLSPSLSAFGKYITGENFLLALTPVICFILLILSCFMSGKTAVVMLFSVLFSLLTQGLCQLGSALCKRGTGALNERYSCGVPTDVSGGLYKCLCALSLLAVEAFTRADAICTSVYRSVVSKRRLLQWKTAASADKSDGKIPIFYAFITFLYGMLFVLTGRPFHCIIGIFILISVPFFIKNKSTETGEKRSAITKNQRAVLMEYIGDTWRFFSENVTERNNFLPPDNVWETPSGKVTARTSPTNIGLYLTSVLAVYDVGLIGGGEVLSRVNKTLDTVEALPKYRGQLYNWYDTQDALPVPPFYVSCVDIGNFLVCLVSLKEGLREIDGADETVSRIEKILADSDISFFADKKRGLLRIGFDTQKEELTPSCYDLYMSEARMTTYFAVSRRQLSVGYWENLSRPSVKCAPFVTSGAWSGTMFEYFMPALFLGMNPCSFSGESLRAGLYAQKKAAEEYGIPYGFSESCFYDEKSPEKYGYKAIGTDRTGVKPDMREEPVVSPYSSFLTLSLDGREALRNLHRLKQSGVYGKYGFYEAADYCRDRKNPDIIRCFMAHHTGMSITAAVNFLCDDVFVKRFMRDGYSDNARGLLLEKLPFFPRKNDGFAKKCQKKL